MSSSRRSSAVAAIEAHDMASAGAKGKGRGKNRRFFPISI
jgi:hypothetical protein